MPSDSRTLIDPRSLTALIGEWIVIATVVAITLILDALWAYAIAGLIIATRQHALLILFHDAVHGHLARPPQLNDALINLFAGVPTLLPVEIYRPLHLLHHRTVGTADDPERQLLYAGQSWNYRPLGCTALIRQLLGDTLLVNGIHTIRAWQRAAGTLAIAPRTVILAALWIAAIAAAVYAAPTVTFAALLLWFVPLLSITQLLQKLRSYAEHSGGPGVTPGWHYWTYSWRVGLLGRLTIWPYNINYHREHHDAPALHWHELPSTDNGAAPQLAGSRLWSLLHRQSS